MPVLMKTTLIAPCGINCGLCSAYIRARNPCPGCLAPVRAETGHRTTCSIKYCAEPGGPARKRRFCFSCGKFPCQRLLNLDRRYRTKYGVSMLENLANVRAHGVAAFVRREKVRWLCPSCGATLCVHRRQCVACGAERRYLDGRIQP